MGSKNLARLGWLYKKKVEGSLYPQTSISKKRDKDAKSVE